MFKKKILYLSIKSNAKESINIYELINNKTTQYQLFSSLKKHSLTFIIHNKDYETLNTTQKKMIIEKLVTICQSHKTICSQIKTESLLLWKKNNISTANKISLIGLVILIIISFILSIQIKTMKKTQQNITNNYISQQRKNLYQKPTSQSNKNLLTHLTLLNKTLHLPILINTIYIYQTHFEIDSIITDVAIIKQHLNELTKNDDIKYTINQIKNNHYKLHLQTHTRS